MSRFASGKWAYGISDRSGQRYRLRDMRKEWNGLLVGKDEWEPKHPQLEPLRVPADPEALRNPRPEQDLPEERNIQWSWDPVGGPPTSSFNPPNNLEANGFVGTVTVVTS